MSDPHARGESEDRREQLLRIGTELFATQPYDEVWITEVARAAGVSRGLLYHYFPGKRAFFTEIIRVETDEMARLTDSDASLPAGERVRLGIDAYLDYAEQHEPGYRAMHRAATGADSEIADDAARRASVAFVPDHGLSGLARQPRAQSRCAA